MDTTERLLSTKINYKSIWYISYPIIIGSIAQNIIQISDTAFLGHLSNTALGAVAIGGLFYIACVMLLWGLSIGTQIIIARRYGENAIREIGITFRYALYLQLIVVAILFLIMQIFGNVIFSQLIHSEAIQNESIKYLNLRSYGIIFSGVNLIFRAFYIGLTKTRIIGISTFAMAVINIFLDYVLIFGKWGFPFLGIEGAALASVIAECFTTIVFIFYTKFKIKLQDFGFFHLKNLGKQKYFKQIFKISFPMMIQLNVSLFSWFIFFIMVEKMGELELAVSNIIRSLYIFLTIPIWGFASAANTLTSQLIGKRKIHEIFPMIKKCIHLNFLMVLIVVSLGVVFSKYLLSLYSTDERVISVSLPTFHVICVSSIMFSFSMTFLQAISGTGKTLNALLIEVVTLTFYLFYAYLMIHRYNQSLPMVWGSEIIYAFLLGLCSFLYLKYGNWKKTSSL